MPAIRNIERFKSDLKSLLETAGTLELALLKELHGTVEVVQALEDKDISETILNKLPAFDVTYEAWYSEGTRAPEAVASRPTLRISKSTLRRRRTGRKLRTPRIAFRINSKGSELPVRHTMK